MTTTTPQSLNLNMEASQFPERNGYTPVVIGWIVAAHIIALAFAWTTFTWTNFFVGLFFYFLTGCFGITLGYHRLLSHRSLAVPKWLEHFFATCGVLALQGSPVVWVSHHRMHHAGSDTHRDPHNAERGFWYSHMTWALRTHPIFDNPDVMRRFARDLWADPYYRLLEDYRVQTGMQVALGLALLAIGGPGMMIWGIFVRVVALYHSTWLVNSAAHIWGYKNYEMEGPDRARNNWIVAVLTFGEGWHNNHHAHPNIAPAGHKWWEFDLTYQVIRFMRAFGLAWNIKELPKSLKMAAIEAELDDEDEHDNEQEVSKPAVLMGSIPQT